MAKHTTSGARVMLHACLWVAVAAGVIGIGVAPAWRPAAIVALAAAGAGASIYLMVSRRRQRREDQEVERLVSDLWSSLGEASPPVFFEGTAHERRIESLRRMNATLRVRLAGLAAERDSLGSLVNALPDPVLATDADGMVVLHNPAAARYFEGRGDLLGRQVGDVFSQAEVLGVYASARAGKPGTAHFRVVEDEGVRVYEVAASPLGGSQASGVVLSLRDETELATAIQLKTDFVANASHELRTPLAAIRGAAETLGEGAWSDRPMRDRLLSMIATNVGRLEDLVRDLLDLSRLESADQPVAAGTVDVRRIVEDIREMLDADLKRRNVRIEAAIDPRLWAINTDGRLLGAILRNLAENAVKFAYEGTAVRIEGEVVPGDPGGPSGARFRVIDRGRGIPLAQQGRIFERFYQVEASRTGEVEKRGSGLGLAIVKHAVKRLGGEVRVESVWKEGTTMTVELPGAVG